MFNLNFGARTNKATRDDVRAMYRSQQSFADLLPWVEYLPESQQILFNDGVSRMAVLNIEPIATAGRSQESLDEISSDIAGVISESFPEEDQDPWTLQIYVNSESELSDHLKSVKSNIRPEIMETEYTQEFLKVYEEHVDQVTQVGSYFIDKEVTDAPWRGRRLQIRICIYRRYWSSKPRLDPEIELENVIERFTTGLQAAGIHPKRSDGADFYRWMLMWLNPSPPEYEHDPVKMVQAVPYPGDDDVSFGRDLAEMVLLNPPVAQKGTWLLDDKPHAVIQVGKLHKRPKHGALTGEILHGEKVYALTDRLPNNFVIAMTVFILAQDKITNRIQSIASRAIGKSAESAITRSEAKGVLEKQARNDKLYPMETAIFLFGDDEHDLRRNISTTRALLNNLGLQSVNPDKDPIALDNFVKNLPGVQVEALDRKARQRARLAFASNIASMAPIYGRSRGTGNAGILAWNRSGEPQTSDPLSAKDRRKNAHMAILGPTGAGKSALLVYVLSSMMAIHRPRVYIIEVGNSFGLWGDHAAEHGLSVNKLALTYSSPISIPPFADVIKLAAKSTADVLDDDAPGLTDEIGDDEDDGKRDILGEAEIIATLMITGGEAKEAERMTRSNRMTIRRAIIAAATTVSARPNEACRTVLPIDIANELHTISKDPNFSDSAKEIREMGDAMLMFCDGINGRLFNRAGELWPDRDITIIDMAQAASKGREDTLAVAYTSLVQHIHAEVERNQMEQRMTIVLTDEGHIITKNHLLMPYVVSITKMWRKLGAWYWIGTQNMKDFPDSAETLLNMIEWWLCLTMPPQEIEEIARFKTLTEEQRGMMRSCTKEPRKYTEGVILSDQLQTLFRNVPPPLALALAQTEKHEKAERQSIMNEQGITEVQAAYVVAQRMMDQRRTEAMKHRL